MLKANWNAQNIMDYVGCGKSKAYEIISTVKKFYGGAIIDLPSCVQRDKVLVYLGTSIEREIYILNERRKANG